MFAKSEMSGVRLEKQICQKELAMVFEIVAEKIRSGEVSQYSIVTEKSSSSDILYEVGERQSMKPIAVMANKTVSPLPAALEPKSLEAELKLIEVDMRLRAIAAQFVPTLA